MSLFKSPPISRRNVQTYLQKDQKIMIAAWEPDSRGDDFTPTHDVMIDDQGEIVGQHLFAWNGGGKDYYSMEWGSDSRYKRNLEEA